MPDAFGRPTEEERMVQAMAQGRMSPNSGMVAGMKLPMAQMTPERAEAMNPDLTAAENNVERQRAMADTMRGGVDTKGKEVGPLDVYMGPNWGEIAADFGLKVGSGLMDRQANKADKEVGKKRQEAVLEKAMYDEQQRQWQRQEDMRLEGKGDTRYEIESAERAEEARREQARLDSDAAYQQRQEDRQGRVDEEARTERERMAARDAARDTATQEARSLETVTIPGVGEPIETLVDAKGNRTYAKGENAGKPVEVNTVDWNTYTDNQRLQMAAEAAATDDQISDVADQIDTDLIKYGKDLQKSNLPATLNSVEEVDKLLAKIEGLQMDPETGEYLNAEKVDVPGTGGFQNLAYVGGAAQWLSGEGAEGSQFRAARQKVKSEILKLMSGAAVTLPEQVRNDIATAMEFWSNDEEFLKTWPAIKRSVYAAKDNYDAAYSPLVTDVYNRRQAGERLTSKDYLREQRAADDELAQLRKLLEEEEQ